MPIDSLRAAEAPGSGQKESRIRIDIIIIIMVANITSINISGGAKRRRRGAAKRPRRGCFNVS